MYIHNLGLERTGHTDLHGGQRHCNSDLIETLEAKLQAGPACLLCCGWCGGQGRLGETSGGCAAVNLGNSFNPQSPYNLLLN